MRFRAKTFYSECYYPVAYEKAMTLESIENRKEVMDCERSLLHKIELWIVFYFYGNLLPNKKLINNN